MKSGAVEYEMTAAQARALHLFQQGCNDEIRSGPHLTKLAKRGYIKRGVTSAYRITAAGMEALQLYQQRPCKHCNGSGFEAAL